MDPRTNLFNPDYPLQTTGDLSSEQQRKRQHPYSFLVSRIWNARMSPATEKQKSHWAVCCHCPTAVSQPQPNNPGRGKELGSVGKNKPRRRSLQSASTLHQRIIFLVPKPLAHLVLRAWHVDPSILVGEWLPVCANKQSHLWRSDSGLFPVFCLFALPSEI